MEKLLELLSRVLNNNSGQSIVEYSLIMAVLMGSLTVMGFDLYPRFIHAFQLYFDSFYFLLNLPIP